MPAAIDEAVDAVVARTALPAYAGTRTRSWDRGLGPYNGESQTLRTIRSRVRAGMAGTTACRVACIGDSKTFGSGIAPGTYTGKDSYPAQLRDLLGGYNSFVVANGSDYRWTSVTNVGAVPANRNDMTFSTGGGSVPFTSDNPHTGFKLYGYLSPGGSVTVTIDGTPRNVDRHRRLPVAHLHQDRAGRHDTHRRHRRPQRLRAPWDRTHLRLRDQAPRRQPRAPVLDVEPLERPERVHHLRHVHLRRRHQRPARRVPTQPRHQHPHRRRRPRCANRLHRHHQGHPHDAPRPRWFSADSQQSRPTTHDGTASTTTPTGSTCPSSTSAE